MTCKKFQQHFPHISIYVLFLELPQFNLLLSAWTCRSRSKAYLLTGIFTAGKPKIYFHRKQWFHCEQCFFSGTNNATLGVTKVWAPLPRFQTNSSLERQQKFCSLRQSHHCNNSLLLWIQLLLYPKIENVVLPSGWQKLAAFRRTKKNGHKMEHICYFRDKFIIFAHKGGMRIIKMV